MSKKRMLCLALGMSVMIASFSGCASGNKTATTEKTEITVWTNNRHDQSIREAQIEKFNNENTDNIKIVYEIKGDNIGELLKLAYSSGNAPDIHNGFEPALERAAITNKWITPLSDEMAKEYREKFLNGAVKTSVVDGKVYKVETGGASGFKFIWNKDLFAQSGLDPNKPPVYWSQVREYAKTITSKGNSQKYGFAIPVKDPVFFRYYAMMPGAPSGLYNTDGFDPKVGKYDFTIYKPMLSFFRDLMADGSVFPTPETLDNDSARAQFAEGNIGMMFAAAWDVGVFNDQFPCKNDWGITDFPTFDGVKGGYPAGIGGGTSFSMNASSKDKEKQLKVWQWLISEDVLKELQIAGKGPYSLRSIQGPEFMNTDKKGAVEFVTLKEPVHLIDQPSGLPGSRITIEGDKFPMVMSKILSDKTSDIDKLLSDLTNRYNDAMKRLEETGVDLSTFAHPDYDPTTYTP